MGSRVWGPAALLAVSILHLHMLGAEAGIWPETAIPVTGEPLRPQIGDNLTLTPGGTLQTLRSCSWYRGPTRKTAEMIVSFTVFLGTWQKEGEAYTGRETAGPNCTLHITNLTALDSGNYTVEKKGYFRLEIGHASVEVSVPEPYLSTLSPGITSLIIIGLFLAVTAGIGAFMYFFACGVNQGSRRCSQVTGPILTPIQPVSNLYQSDRTSSESTEALSMYLEYEYLTSGQVKSGISSDTNCAYEALHLSHESQDVYHDLRIP